MCFFLFFDCFFFYANASAQERVQQSEHYTDSLTRESNKGVSCRVRQQILFELLENSMVVGPSVFLLYKLGILSLLLSVIALLYPPSKRVWKLIFSHSILVSNNTRFLSSAAPPPNNSVIVCVCVRVRVCVNVS